MPVNRWRGVSGLPYEVVDAKHYDALASERDRLAEALRFYANPRRYLGPNQSPLDNDEFTPQYAAYMQDVLRDKGELARAALDAAKGEG